MRIFGAHEAFPRGGRPHIFRPITLVIGEPIHFTAAISSATDASFTSD
jgi:1-acyl-sn-glycerol-3-phosphate acyltransferase